MNLEKYNPSPTVKAIYEHYEASRENSHRPHLGGSQIGNPCSRALWYQFRHASSQSFEGRMLRLFETGDREEERIVANLRAIGVEVWEVDPETGRQINYTACGGHFGLSLDGIGVGFPESKETHTLEFKTMNDKSFAQTKMKGVRISKPIYWAQCQVGMHLADIDRCYFFAVNKNTDEIYAERIKRDRAEGEMLISKASNIIFDEKPPSKISHDPSKFACRFCSYIPICHGGELPEVNDRTDAHSTPERDGTWSRKEGAGGHLFNPFMVPDDWEIIDAGDDFVEYQTPKGVIRNQDNSEELREKFSEDAK